MEFYWSAVYCGLALFKQTEYQKSASECSAVSRFDLLTARAGIFLIRRRVRAHSSEVSLQSRLGLRAGGTLPPCFWPLLTHQEDRSFTLHSAETLNNVWCNTSAPTALVCCCSSPVSDNIPRSPFVPGLSFCFIAKTGFSLARECSQLSVPKQRRHWGTQTETSLGAAPHTHFVFEKVLCTPVLEKF